MSLEFSLNAYGPDRLQTIGIYKRESISSSSSSVASNWLIYIHGGAWRDPSNTYKDGQHLIQETIPGTTNWAAASINYRLSPQVLHPEHINDVINGLKYLNEHYSVDNFIIVGHSAGAFLALQTTLFMDDRTLLDKCRVMVLVEGIYDLKLMIKEDPSYDVLVTGAFGHDANEWDKASPASGLYRFVAGYDDISDNNDKIPIKLKTSFVIVHSKQDELLSYEIQPVALKKVLSMPGSPKYTIEMVSGKHDEVYTGAELVAIVKKVISEVDKPE